MALLAAGAGCGGAQAPQLRAAAESADDPGALVAVADSAIVRGDAETARRALDRALAIAPLSFAVRVARGRFYTAIRRYHDAKGEFDRAAELDPGSPEPHYLLGAAYLSVGQRELAIASLTRALALDPAHAGARESLAPLLAARYEAAGIPGEYPRLAEHATLSRGELGVILAVELGTDPDRSVWRSDEPAQSDPPELDGAWGARWLRASVARRWIAPFPDGSLHLDDPVTRGALALLLARLSSAMVPDSALVGVPELEFPDVGPRHYLGRAAARAVRLGLPTRDGGRFEPLAGASGLEALRAVRGLARAAGATPLVPAEP
jgi:tetratricopeptide (TPR) repeat protein